LTCWISTPLRPSSNGWWPIRTIHTICRDRNGRYAKAARRAAPAAQQVADRFHLVQNLRETIERELALLSTCI